MLVTTAKAVSAAAVKNNSGAVPFGQSPKFKIMGKSLLNVAHKKENTPVQSAVEGTAKPFSPGTFGYIAAGQYILTSYSDSLSGYTASIMKSAKGNLTKAVHNNTNAYTRRVTSYDYATGAAEGVTEHLDAFGRDDAYAIPGEFVFIPAGGRIPTQGGDNSLYYTY